MLVFKNKAKQKIKYPLEQFDKKDKILFFDIETTGFSRQYCNVYLIGCMYYIGDELMYCQWLTENFNEEANILMAFHKFLQKFNTIIHFNGNTFDMPFLQERGEKYKLDFNFEKFNSIDIYKPLSKLNHILKTENQKQKTFEKMLGLNREDPFTGGDLIEVFKHYVESKDERLIYPLLLHNLEDVLYMGDLTSLLAISDLFNHRYTIQKYEFKEYTSLTDDLEKELIIVLNLDNALPIKLSYTYNNISMQAFETKAQLSIKVTQGSYKYFFKNYKDYFYLPLEDRAIHKSVSSIVDKNYRQQATATTCYEKFSGEFLPISSNNCPNFNTIFKEEYKSKESYIRTKTINNENIYEYCTNIINQLKQKPKNIL